MSIIKINSYILAIYFYIVPISLLFSPILNEFIARTSIIIFVTLCTLLINKFKITKKIIVFYVILLFLLFLNILVVSYRDYVFADGINFLIFSFIPIYLITQRLISFAAFKDSWMKLAIIFTYFLPLYYIYKQFGYVSYFHIGFIAHLNIIIILYTLLSENNKLNVLSKIYILINFIVLAILGSRMVLIATIITCFITYILLSNRKGIKFYLNIFIIIILGIFVSKNLIIILNSINNLMLNFGIKSRNLTLFISQLSGKYEDSNTFFSGRDQIYPIVLEYLLDKGVFPSGLGIARKLTDGLFYHSHNFLIELLLIFGLFGFLILFFFFLIKFTFLFKNRYILENDLILNFLIILISSFLIRSLTGTHFVTDVIFLFCLGIILSIRKDSHDVYSKK